VRTWLLLRGWTREAAHWGGFIDAMRAALPGDRIAPLDLPGAGRFHRERTPASIEAVAACVRDRAGREGLAPPLNLFGLSMGGMVAMEWARAHPAEVAALVLVNTSARPFCRMHRRLRIGALGDVLAIAAARDARTKESAIYRLTANAPAMDAESVIGNWVRVRRDRPVSASNALRQLLAAARYRAPEAPPCERVLVLASERDRLVHPACSRRLASAWKVPLVTHPAAGHDLPLEDGPWAARETARWLAG
jgi:pimeloyl-ACP methyl ester carboxylesterase